MLSKLVKMNLEQLKEIAFFVYYYILQHSYTENKYVEIKIIKVNLKSQYYITMIHSYNNEIPTQLMK